MALKKVRGNFERMFDKNLTDLVRGIRNNKENEVVYIFFEVMLIFILLLLGQIHCSMHGRYQTGAAARQSTGQE